MRMRIYIGLAAAFAVIACSPAHAQSPSSQPSYDTPVSDPAVISDVTARLTQDFQALAIPAHVQSCDLMMMVGKGVAESERAFGAACQVAIGGKPPVWLLLCDSDYGGTFTMSQASFVRTREWIAGFVHKACYD